MTSGLLAVEVENRGEKVGALLYRLFGLPGGSFGGPARSVRPGPGSGQGSAGDSRRAPRAGNRLTVGWTPAHAGVKRNEQADEAARHATEGGGNRVGHGFLREANPPYLMRKTAEARSQATSTWIRVRVKRRHRYRPHPGGKLRKRLTGRFYQLLSGHAATTEHLKRVGQASSDRCWWCGSGERQTRYHLLVRCWRWLPEIRRLWQRVEADCEWGAPAPRPDSSSGIHERPYPPGVP